MMVSDGVRIKVTLHKTRPVDRSLCLDTYNTPRASLRAERSFADLRNTIR